MTAGLLVPPRGSLLVGSKSLLTYQPERESPDMMPLQALPPTRVRFSPYNLMFMGRRDAGKSLTMTILASAQKERYGKWSPGYKIFSNYYVKFADISTPFLMEDIIRGERQLQRGYACIDEIQTAASSRRSMTTGAINIGIWLTMVRKLKIEVNFTTQIPQFIDTYVLAQTDGFVHCEKFEGGRGVKLYFFDYWGQLTGNFVRRKFPLQPWQADTSMAIFGADQVWGDYDTDQVIVSRYMDDEARETLVQSSWEGKEIRDWQEEMKPKIELPETIDARVKVIGERAQDTFWERLPATFQPIAYVQLARVAGIIPPDGSLKQFLEACVINGLKVTHRGQAYYAERTQK